MAPEMGELDPGCVGQADTRLNLRTASSSLRYSRMSVTYTSSLERSTWRTTASPVAT